MRRTWKRLGLGAVLWAALGWIVDGILHHAIFGFINEQIGEAIGLRGKNVLTVGTSVIIAGVIASLAALGIWLLARQYYQAGSIRAATPAPPPAIPTIAQPAQSFGNVKDSTIFMGDVNVHLYQNAFTTAATVTSTTEPFRPPSEMKIHFVSPEVVTDYAAIEFRPSFLHQPSGIVNSNGVASVTDRGVGDYKISFVRQFKASTIERMIWVEPQMPYDVQVSSTSIRISTRGREPDLLKVLVHGQLLT